MTALSTLWLTVALAALPGDQGVPQARLAAIERPTADAPGQVRGSVRGAEDGRPLPGATIRLLDGSRATLADEAGGYVLREVEPGVHRLRAERVGFAPLEVELALPPGGAMQVDFLLAVSPVPMRPVTARAASGAGAAASVSESAANAMSSGAAAVRLLDATPGVSEMGIASTARALLGPDPAAPDNILYVRGAGAALDVVLIDGAPVHAPFHLGGLLEPGVTPGVVRATRMHGGASARHDGGLTDVLRLETRDAAPGPLRSAGFVDLVSAGGALQGGEEEGARMYLEGRSLHGAGGGPFVDGAFPQRYADVLLRVDVPSRSGDTVRLTGYWNRESVEVPALRGRGVPHWGNTAVAARYAPAALGGAELGVAVGDFGTYLPLGGDVPLEADGRARRARVTFDFREDSERASVDAGLHWEHLSLQTRFATDVRAAIEAADLVRDLTGSERLLQTSQASTLSGYVDGTTSLGGSVRLGGGLRANLYDGGLGQALSPRVRLDVGLEDDVTLHLSAGRYHQLVPVNDSALSRAFIVGASDGQTVGTLFTEIVPAAASHLVFGLSRAGGHRSEFRIETSWKAATGLPELEDGTLYRTGIEFWLRRRLERVSLWGTYSMGWAWTVSPAGERERLFSGRHWLRAGGVADLPGGLRLDADVAFGAGLEFGAVPRREPVEPPEGVALQSVEGDDELPRPPDDSYLRLNVGLSTRVEARVFGRSTSLRPYFRLINALDRRDALFFQFDRAAGPEAQAVGAVPVLPVIGLEWRM